MGVRGSSEGKEGQRKEREGSSRRPSWKAGYTYQRRRRPTEKLYGDQGERKGINKRPRRKVTLGNQLDWKERKRVEDLRENNNTREGTRPRAEVRGERTDRGRYKIRRMKGYWDRRNLERRKAQVRYRESKEREERRTEEEKEEKKHGRRVRKRYQLVRRVEVERNLHERRKRQGREEFMDWEAQEDLRRVMEARNRIWVTDKYTRTEEKRETRDHPRKVWRSQRMYREERDLIKQHERFDWTVKERRKNELKPRRYLRLRLKRSGRRENKERGTFRKARQGTRQMRGHARDAEKRTWENRVSWKEGKAYEWRKTQMDGSTYSEVREALDPTSYQWVNHGDTEDGRPPLTPRTGEFDKRTNRRRDAERAGTRTEERKSKEGGKRGKSDEQDRKKRRKLTEAEREERDPRRRDREKWRNRRAKKAEDEKRKEGGKVVQANYVELGKRLRYYYGTKRSRRWLEEGRKREKRSNPKEGKEIGDEGEEKKKKKGKR